MIVLRITRGIAAHFPIRQGEWFMAWPALAMGAALIAQPDMFDTSPSFGTLAKWGSEALWACIVLSYALQRLASLTVNGTFEGFRYSPHLRALASFTGLAFWSQFCLGFLSSAIFGNGAWSAPIAYSTLAIFELANLYRSGSDIGRASRR